MTIIWAKNVLFLGRKMQNKFHFNDASDQGIAREKIYFLQGYGEEQSVNKGELRKGGFILESFQNKIINFSKLSLPR